jgi:hypothetical protein
VSEEDRFMGIPVSFEGIEQKSFDPLPVGRYPAKVSGVTYNESSQRSDEPYIAWEFTVSEGEYANRKAFLNSSLQAANEAEGKKDARWATMRILSALGFTDEEIKSKEWDFEDPEIVDSLMDRDCVVSIGHQKYEGETRQRVRRVLPAGGESEKAGF